MGKEDLRQELAADFKTEGQSPNAYLKEISERLFFLVNVGLDYLTLTAPRSTLSGGEAQRIRLATQVGSGWSVCCMCWMSRPLDCIPRDNARLLATLKGLRDLGNTVLVVEHDDETIREADWIVDLGPAAGEHGGRSYCGGNAGTDSGASKVIDGSLSLGAQAGRNPEGEAGGKRQIAEDRRCFREQLKKISMSPSR